MKILFNCLTIEKGGAERVISILANEFAKEDDVVVLTLKKNVKDAYKFNNRIKRLHVDKTSYEQDSKIRRFFRKISIMRLFRLRSIIIEEKPDIIVSFLPEPSLRLMFISKYSSRVRKIPKIVSIRNDPEKEFSNIIMRFAMKRLYKHVDGMVYQTESAKKYFKDIVKTKNQIIIQNPIDEKFLVNPKDDKNRKNVIISVGRLERQKNHEMLIRAFSEIMNKNKDNYTLEIYGDGSRRKYLQDIINEMGLSKRVFLKGKTDGIVQKLNDSKIFVLSSRYEGLPNALLEAMALGLPCISTDCPCGGPRSLIKNKKNGILIKNEDENALCKALLEIMDDCKKRVVFAKNALSVRRDNDINKIIAQWWKVIVNGTKK